MPELPEVETTRRALEPHLLHQKIKQVEIRRRDLRQPITEHLEEILQGQRFTALRRIGKYLLLDTDGGETLLVHLGMSGSFRISAPFRPSHLKKHDHLLIHLPQKVTAAFHDPRRFGVILLVRTAEAAAHPLLAQMSVDPLSEAFTADYLHTQLQRYRTPVKIALLHQHVVAGMGNIYASESLFRAAIHPERAANTLTRKEAATLVKAIQAVLQDALHSGGSTLRDYVSGENLSGYFQHHFQVYDQEAEPCPRCRESFIQRKVMGGRSTYFCHACQK
jgi:formamidopyrimidine-DNA glycosylase